MKSAFPEIYMLANDDNTLYTTGNITVTPVRHYDFEASTKTCEWTSVLEIQNLKMRSSLLYQPNRDREGYIRREVGVRALSGSPTHVVSDIAILSVSEQFSALMSSAMKLK